MNNKPNYPIILTEDITWTLDLIETDDRHSLTNTTALGLIKDIYKKYKVYDKDGLLWIIDKVDSNYKLNGLKKFLARTIYNPFVKVTLTWKKIGEYNLDELKKDICNQVDKDDDIITQWEEGDFIKHKIKNCNSFDDIVATLNKYVFKVDEEKLWKEQESRR
jgi:hypothetical protein